MSECVVHISANTLSHTYMYCERIVYTVYTLDPSSCKELRHVPRNCIGARCGFQTATHSKRRYIIIITLYLHSACTLYFPPIIPYLYIQYIV